jgi:hypothetical protein
MITAMIVVALVAMAAVCLGAFAVRQASELDKALDRLRADGRTRRDLLRQEIYSLEAAVTTELEGCVKKRARKTPPPLPKISAPGNGGTL